MLCLLLNLLQLRTSKPQLYSASITAVRPLPSKVCFHVAAQTDAQSAEDRALSSHEVARNMSADALLAALREELNASQARVAQLDRQTSLLQQQLQQSDEACELASRTATCIREENAVLHSRLKDSQDNEMQLRGKLASSRHDAAAMRRQVCAN